MSQPTKKPEIATGAKAGGGVDRDSRGHNVWRWKQAGADSTSIVLKRLENDELHLEPTQSVPIPRRSDADRRRLGHGAAATSGDTSADTNELSVEQTRSVKRGGFNPYDHS